MNLVNIAEILRRQRERRPEHTAVAFEGETWSYRRLDGEVDRFAAKLDASGFPADGVVAIYLDSLPELVIAYLGTLRAGRVANIINGSLKGPEAHFILADSQSRLLVTDEQRAASLERLERLPHLERNVLAGRGFAEYLDDAPQQAVCPETSADRLSTLMYTSGTTGRPKGVMLSHKNIIDNATRFGRIHFKEDDRLVVGAPLFHCWGLINGLLGVLSAGGTAIIMRRFQTDTALDLVLKEQATQFLGVAAMYNFMLKSPRAKEALPAQVRPLGGRSDPGRADRKAQRRVRHRVCGVVRPDGDVSGHHDSPVHTHQTGIVREGDGRHRAPSGLDRR